MPLPFKIVDVNTATWSDYTNSFSAVYNAINSMYNVTSDGSLVFGNTIEYIDWKFAGSQPGPLLRAYIYADKVGSPTFNVSMDLYADDGSGNPDLNNKLSTGVIVSASAFPTTAALVQFSFLVPKDLNITDTYHVVFKASAAGDGSNHVRIYKDSGGTLGQASSSNTGTRDFGSSTWTYPGTVDVIRGALFVEQTASNAALWAVAIDKTNNKIRIYKSTDGGATWAEVSSASAKSCVSSAGYKTIQVSHQIRTSVDYFPYVWIRYPDATNTMALAKHQVTAGGGSGWSLDASSESVGTINTDVASNRPVHYGRRLNAETVTVVQGVTETVMGSPRRRVKMLSPSGTIVDVVGSANSPLANTLPGTAVDYEIRLVFTDAENRIHIFYSASDTNNIQHRVLNTDNTFSTINTIGSTPAVCSNTSAYPIGLGCNYYKNNEWRIAILYLDSTSGTIKVAHCKAADSATASSWTIEQISADTPEVTTANLGFLSADSQQSGQLIALYAKSDDTLWMTKDNGTGTWSTPVQWRSGQAVAGISGFLTARNLNFQYLDTAPATDELKFDSL